MEEPVRSQARLDQTKRLSNAILRRTVVNVVLFMVIYLVLYGGFVTVFGSTVSNAVYELLDYNYALHTLASNLFLVLTAIGFVAGIVLVVRSGINRALRYFDLLLDSVSDILAKSDGPVMLPGELAPTAMALNTIKATSEQNERAAKAAEDRKNELVVYLAHDIKTPLTSIIGYLTLLEESPTCRSRCVSATRASRWTRPTGSRSCSTSSSRSRATTCRPSPSSVRASMPRCS
ncbi:MAG: histidine kinase dimerization/phospho-acceptor domain-containing protein [Eggerthella lenta]